MTDSYSRAELNVKSRKTVVMCKPSPVSPHTDQNFLVGKEPISIYILIVVDYQRDSESHPPGYCSLLEA